MLKHESASRALREANKLFKPAAAKPILSEYAEAQKSFQQNRERLKAERLARDAAAGHGGK